LAQIGSKANSARKSALNVRVVGLAKTEKCFFDEDGIDLSNWNEF
jgi:hypothetical protein